MTEDTGRISVSRDALRAELGELELRLVEKLATKAEVEALEVRITTLEEAVARLKGALALLSITAVALGGLIIKLLGG